jgi:ketosteroid isomerase-like protein
VSFLDAFIEAHRRGQVHFNRGDYKSAFAGLPDDVQWHNAADLLESGVISGRDALVAYFESGQDAGDWEVHAQEFDDLGNGRVLIRQRGKSTGRTSRITGQREFFQVWTVGDDGLVHEVREFSTREEALAAAAS